MKPMLPRILRLALLTLLLLLAPLGAARAHDARYSSVTLRPGPDGLRVRAVVALSRLHAADRAAEALRAIDVRSGGAEGRPVSLTLVSSEVAEERGALLVEALGGDGAPPPPRLYVGRMYPADPSAKTLVSAYDASGGLARQEILDAGRPSVTIGGAEEGAAERQDRPGRVFARFVGAGVHHIFIGPDHILFVVALLLLGGPLRTLVKTVTAFTVAHSVTLTLAALGLWNPPSSVVEPLIALSIVCVGADNLSFRTGDRDLRPLLAFGFGFVHGFGFAGVLQEAALPRESLGLSLFSFNVGVEVGQACIVLAVAPLLALLARRRPSLARRVTFAGSLLVIAAGVFWFTQRVLYPGS